MCLATEPQVLLLDEPLAGMGAAEAERMVELLLKLKADHAILLVEHDMDAVFALADRLTVMVNGQVIASGTPAAVRANRGVQAAYLGGGPLMATDLLIRRHAACTPTTAPATSCTASISPSRRGETIGLMGRNGMGKSTLLEVHAGPGASRAAARCRSWASAMTRARAATRSRGCGIAYVPEGRGIFPNLTVRENLVMAARAGTRRPARLDLRARAGDLPAPGRAPGPRRRAALAAASSRC